MATLESGFGGHVKDADLHVSVGLCPGANVKMARTAPPKGWSVSAGLGGALLMDGDGELVLHHPQAVFS